MSIWDYADRHPLIAALAVVAGMIGPLVVVFVVDHWWTKRRDRSKM